ncbi:protein FAM185A-like [Clavelina lepadiformis]|uniref:protein FAM185A-like n=1 Tax=Clavelina lepadiformis TaxID=159417 RepID=UPI0040418D83
MLKTATLLIPQRIVLWRASRLFSKQHTTPIKTWSLPVQPFWQLSADVKNCNITVESLSPVQNVEGDKMEVHLHASSADAVGDYEIVCSSELRKVNITNKIGKPGLVHVLLPVAFDLQLNLKNRGNLKVSNMEGDSFIFNVENGATTLYSIKGRNIEVKVNDGDITAEKILQGNISLETKCGSIRTEKLQGPAVRLKTFHGPIQAQDVYTEDFDSSSCNGSTRIKTLHGRSNLITQNGSLVVGTMEGEISCESCGVGDVDVHIMNTTRTDIKSNSGNVKLSVASDIEADVDIEGKVITGQESLNLETSNQENLNGTTGLTGSINRGGPRIKVQSLKGAVHLQTMSWWRRTTVFKSLAD